MASLEDRIIHLENAVFGYTKAAYTETKNNTGKAHKIIYQDDWQYCFCSIGQNHNETTKENNHG